MEKVKLKILHEWDIETLLLDPILKVVVLADLHTGSVYGYLTLGMTSKRGTEIKLTPEQRRIHQRLIAELTKVGHVDVLIIAGDICEGKQIKIGGIDLSDTDTDTMVSWAVSGIREICSILTPNHIVIVKGTDYHGTTGIGGDLDYQVANALSNDFKVYYGLPIANIKLGKLQWRISHRYPTTRNITPPMEQIYKEICTDAHIKGYKVPDVFVWAHVHQCIEPHRIVSSSAYGMICPCLKINDPYISQGFYSKMPDVGFIVIEQDGDYLSGQFKRIEYRK